MALTVPCTPDEHRLIVGGATQLVVPGDLTVDWGDMGCGKFIAPPRWVEATGPCPTCEGEGILGINLEPPDQGIHWCKSCEGTGRKRVALAAPCSHQGHVRNQYDPKDERQWGGYGTGNHRGIERCDGEVVFAHATVEVLPVVDGHGEYRPTGNYVVMYSHFTNQVAVITGDSITSGPIRPNLDPLPVPGRDWIVVLDNVEMT